MGPPPKGHFFFWRFFGSIFFAVFDKISPKVPKMTPLAFLGASLCEPPRLLSWGGVWVSTHKGLLVREKVCPHTTGLHFAQRAAAGWGTAAWGGGRASVHTPPPHPPWAERLWGWGLWGICGLPPTNSEASEPFSSPTSPPPFVQDTPFR